LLLSSIRATGHSGNEGNVILFSRLTTFKRRSTVVVMVSAPPKRGPMFWIILVKSAWNLAPIKLWRYLLLPKSSPVQYLCFFSCELWRAYGRSEYSWDVPGATETPVCSVPRLHCKTLLGKHQVCNKLPLTLSVGGVFRKGDTAYKLFQKHR
jgi:hypothetical protein